MPDSRKSSRVTLHDVAKLAGVSVISASRVMRNAPNISDSLKETVKTAANQLGYTPNRLAGGLRNQTSNLVAVVVPSMSNAVFPEVLDGIDSVLRPSGLQPILGITHYDQDREIDILRDMLSWFPHGVILTGTDQDPSIKAMLRNHDIPVVQVMDSDQAPFQVAVGSSSSAAARAVADFIVDRGYKNIGYIGAWGEKPLRSKTRRLAFQKRLVELGVPLRGYEISDESSSTSVGSQATGALLSRFPEIDCIFFANDDLAVGGMFHCLKHDIKVPSQLGLIGFNGIDVGTALPIPLTTVVTHRFKMGVEAAKFMLQPKPLGEKNVDLGFRLRLGKSA